MSIHCPKCQAGAGALEALVETLADGTTLQTVRCVMCGERRSRIAPGRLVENPGRPQVNKSGPKKVLSRATMEARIASVAKHSAPCAVKGCEGTYYTLTATLPLCKKHRMRLRSWENTQRATAPPVACVNGQWVERGAALPAVPGECPAPEAEEAKLHKPPVARKRSKPRQKSAAIPAPVLPYEKLEAQLDRLAGLGNPSARALISALAK
ncbi:hypothetical protein [Desulfuromonas sp. TF]|uniref:hypothetical protein n=1 Tax=Desulfuromonas sp. TF TaxID=1232410 RepID=UPI0004098C6C|nr:hypothetical protein [Desulfuromonas sp. TF]